jgi:hypothetical protein
MIAISLRQYPTSWDGQAERASSGGGVDPSILRSHLVQLATMRTTLTRGVAQVEPKKAVVERRRCAYIRLDDARAPRAARFGGVSLAAQRD